MDLGGGGARKMVVVCSLVTLPHRKQGNHRVRGSVPSFLFLASTARRVLLWPCFAASTPLTPVIREEVLILAAGGKAEYRRQDLVISTLPTYLEYLQRRPPTITRDDLRFGFASKAGLRFSRLLRRSAPPI